MTADFRASRNEGMREKIRAYHASLQYETVDINWGEEAESLKRCIVGALRERTQPDQPWMEIEQARAIQERLLDEIPSEGFLEMPKVAFAYNQEYEKELKPGDPLLIK